MCRAHLKSAPFHFIQKYSHFVEEALVYYVEEGQQRLQTFFGRIPEVAKHQLLNLSRKNSSLYVYLLTLINLAFKSIVTREVVNRRLLRS